MGLHHPVFPFNISCNFNHYSRWMLRPQHYHAPLFTIPFAITCAFNHYSRSILLPQHFCEPLCTIHIEMKCASNHVPVQYYVCSISVHLYSLFPSQSCAPLTTIRVEYYFRSIQRFLLKSRAPLITIPIQYYGLYGLRSADSVLRTPFCGLRSADSAADSTEFVYIFNHYSHWILHPIASYNSIGYRTCEWHTNIWYTRIEIGFSEESAAQNSCAPLSNHYSHWMLRPIESYGVATISRLLKMIRLVCRI